MKKTYIQPASKVYEIKPASEMLLTVSTEVTIQKSEFDNGNYSISTDRFRRGSSWDEE